ncbi:MAG TPA: GAF domain-containing protein, partial [Candidatus Limnocylindria bacterium]|nr:GAF domain-containing protein [Candidatus Limnocylindria bacterium]
MRAGAKKPVKAASVKKAAKRPAATISKDDAREQLAAVSRVMKALADPTIDVDRIGDMIVTAMIALSGADNGSFMRREGPGWVVAATHGDTPLVPGALMEPVPGSIWGRAVLSGRRFHYADTKLAEPALPDAEKRRTRMAVPIMREREAIGVLIMSRNDPGGFETSTIALVETFADQLAVAMENARLLRETKEGLERQTAISEILRVITGSPTNVLPVFEAIADSAIQFCGAEDAVVMLPRGQELRIAAHRGPVPMAADLVYPLDGTSGNAVAFAEARVVHLPDLRDPATIARFPLGAATGQRFGFRAAVVAPLLREGAAIGCITLRRFEPGPFTERQIELLQTFADQAAIAIENVRLFNETKESLAQQTAVSDVLASITSSAFDLDAVLRTVLDRARSLCAAEHAMIVRRVAGEGPPVLKARPEGGSQAEGFLVTAYNGPADFMHERIAEQQAAGWYWLGPGDDVAIGEGRSVQIVDLKPDELPPRGFTSQTGSRSRLSVPLVRDGQVIGLLIVSRTRPEGFTTEQIGVVETFARQAVIAMDNVRLFNETKDALERQTAISDILRVISSSPTDVQPVLNTIAESAARFCRADDAAIALVGDGAQTLTATARGVAQAPISFSPSHRSVTPRVIAEGRLFNVPDMEALPDDEFDEGKAYAREHGYRAFLAAPLLKD